MARVNHFEIPADRPERATMFYRQAFGWSVRKWDGPQDYWLVSTGKAGELGIDGAIIKRTTLPTVTPTVGVDSVDEFVKRIMDAGGNFVTSKIVFPGQGHTAYCVDTEGNLFGVMQMDRPAVRFS